MKMKSMKIWIGLCLVMSAGFAPGITRWKGGTSGTWDVATNWAGGFPTANTTVRLDHQNQTNEYTVLVQGTALTDKLWMEDFGAVPVHVTIQAGGLLQVYDFRMGGKLTDQATTLSVDGGILQGLGPTNPVTGTATSFAIGDNPGCDATLAVSGGGELVVEGDKDLVIASGGESVAHLDVGTGTVRVSDSLILGKGQGSFGELVMSGSSVVTVTGALQVAKSELGAVAATGVVHIADGVLECGAINVGANGEGVFNLNGGIARAFSGGVVLGREGSVGRLNIHGGELETVASAVSIGHTDSTGFLTMTGGTMTVDGNINVGSAAKSAGTLELSDGTIHAYQFVAGSAATGTGTVTVTGGALHAADRVTLGLLGPSTLSLQGGTLTSSNLVVGQGHSAGCDLLGGELVVDGTDADSFQISNSVVQIEQALVRWANSNVTAWVTNQVEKGALTWSNGLAAGTYSTHGFDGQVVNGNTALYWDNADNGSQFGQSGIWVEQVSPESLYEEWASGFGLGGDDAGLSADPDSDGLYNLVEYGLGGNPTNAMDVGISPVVDLVEDGGTNWFEYVYRRRTDAAGRGLDYWLQLNDDLTVDGWTDAGYVVVGTGPIGNGFDAVTNRVPTVTFTNVFVRLGISAE